MAKRQRAVPANWLLGKKIVGVETVTNRSRDETLRQEIIALTLDDGSRLLFQACEGEEHSFVTPIYTRGPGKGRRKAQTPKTPSLPGHR